MNYKQGIINFLHEQRIPPELKVQDFDDYMALINGDYATDIETFLSEDHSFEEYCEKILFYKDIADNIPIKMEHMVRIGMYDIDRNNLIQDFVDVCNDFKDQLVKRMTANYQANCRQ